MVQLFLHFVVDVTVDCKWLLLCLLLSHADLMHQVVVDLCLLGLLILHCDLHLCESVFQLAESIL